MRWSRFVVMWIPRSLRCSSLAALAALGVVGVACGGGRFETALSVPTTPRQPDGVLVEPPPVLPRGEDHGSATSSVVSLRPPISDEQIATIVKAYVRALEEESTELLFELFTPDVVSIAPPVPGVTTRPGNVRNDYATRFQQGARSGPGNPMSLKRYRGLEIAQLDKVERFDWSDLTKNSDPPRPNEMRDGDLFVRVPLVAPLGPNGDKLIGDVLLLMLRRDSEAKKVRVAGIAEFSTN